MPQVPVTPRTQLRAIPTTPMHARDTGDVQAFVDGAQSLGDVNTEALLREQEVRNADRLLAATAAVQEEYRTFETGLRDRRGVNAWGVTTDVAKWWEEAAKRHTEGLENDVQRRHFGEQVTKLRAQSLDTASTFESDQRRVSLDTSAKAARSAATNFAAANHMNPDAVESSKRDVLASLDITAHLNGWDSVTAAVERGKALTDFHKQMIVAKIDSDPSGAAAYFEAHKDEIDGTVRSDVHEFVKKGAVREQAQAVVDDLERKPLAEALRIAREKYSGDLEDEVTRRLKERAAEDDAIIERGQRRAADDAWQIFGRSKKLSDIPLAMLNSLDGRTRIALEAEAKAQAEGARITTDWDTYYALKAQAIDAPAKFAATDLRTYFPKLDESERKYFIDLQQTVADPAKRHDVATWAAQLSSVHDEMGWTGKDGAEKRGLFDRVAEAAVQAERRRLGREMNDEERRKVLDQLLINGTIPGWLGGKDRQRFEVVGTPDEANFTVEVPDTERAAIEAALTKAKLPVTDEAVRALYLRKKGLQ